MKLYLCIYREKLKSLFLKKDINSNESLVKRDLDLLFIFKILNKNLKSAMIFLLHDQFLQHESVGVIHRFRMAACTIYF